MRLGRICLVDKLQWNASFLGLFHLIITMLNPIALPYSFAKRHQLLLQYSQDLTAPPTLLMTADTPMEAINEANRFASQAGVPLPLNFAMAQSDDFEKQLAAVYAGNTGESQHIAAGLEDPPDLMSLADSVPETED